MHQIVQHHRTGKISVEDFPAPRLKKNGVLVRNMFSLISAGTERTSVETAQSSIIGKARSRPDLVRQVVNHAKREGLWATYRKVQSRLDDYKELGYSCAGVVLQSSTEEFRPGDHVACGGSTANHAELIVVPKNLAVKIPEGVDFEEAAFTTLGAIAVQGVRQADVRVGESVAVVGLGLIGVLTVQILKAAGCRVIGLDISTDNFDLARKLGCDQCVKIGFAATRHVKSFTGGYGTDAVLLTAATSSNEPLELALEVARKKSKIVVVGAVGMNVPRSPFYEKELDLRISSSYGPGRYDRSYEQEGHDYPIAYVRWTENRNMSSFLNLVSEKKVDVRSLITHRIPIEIALTAYDIIIGKKKERYLGILLQYPDRESVENRSSVRVTESASPATPRDVTIGFIGAGHFAQSYLIPFLDKKLVRLKSVVTQTPVHGKAVSEKFKFELFGTDPQTTLSDHEITTVFIATRHDSHARFVVDALKAGKQVFVEKPLALNTQELKEISKAIRSHPNSHVLTGFNRRFSAPMRDIKAFFSEVKEPLNLLYRVNAGFIPKSSWVQSESQGGRIIGEVCHFVDTISYVSGSLPVQVYAEYLDSRNVQMPREDNLSVIIRYANGSVGTIVYLAIGSPSLPKEYCEVSAGGASAVMENFDRVLFYGVGKVKKRSYDGSKGHREEVAHFIALLQGKVRPEISFESMYKTTLTTFAIRSSLRTGRTIKV